MGVLPVLQTRVFLTPRRPSRFFLLRLLLLYSSPVLHPRLPSEVSTPSSVDGEGESVALSLCTECTSSETRGPWGPSNTKFGGVLGT